MNTRPKFFHLWLLVFTVALLIAPTAQGQTINDPPPIPTQLPLIAPWAAAVELHSVDAVVEGPVANVTVKQIFRNDSMQTVEATYLFPLPADVAALRR